MILHTYLVIFQLVHGKLTPLCGRRPKVNRDVSSPSHLVVTRDKVSVEMGLKDTQQCQAFTLQDLRKGEGEGVRARGWREMGLKDTQQCQAFTLQDLLKGEGGGVGG